MRATLPFQGWIAEPATATRLMLKPGAPALASRARPEEPFELVVGPEGGFSERELDLAASRCEAVSLGPRVLRTETAPLAALAVIQALWGDFRAA